MFSIRHVTSKHRYVAVTWKSGGFVDIATKNGGICFWVLVCFNVDRVGTALKLRATETNAKNLEGFLSFVTTVQLCSLLWHYLEILPPVRPSFYGSILKQRKEHWTWSKTWAWVLTPPLISSLADSVSLPRPLVLIETSGLINFTELSWKQQTKKDFANGGMLCT